MFGVWRRFVGSGRGVIAFALFIGILVCCDKPGFAQAQTERVTVINNAPIYLLPDSARAPLRTAAAGTVLEVVTDEGPWIQVRFQDPQFGIRVGYVESRFIRRAAQQPELRPLDLSVPQSSSALASAPASQPPAARPPGDVPNGSDGDVLVAGPASGVVPAAVGVLLGRVVPAGDIDQGRTVAGVEFVGGLLPPRTDEPAGLADLAVGFRGRGGECIADGLLTGRPVADELLKPGESGSLAIKRGFGRHGAQGLNSQSWRTWVNSTDN